MADIQKLFFETLKELIPRGSSMAFEVAELLHCSEDSAYRRIRGDTQLGMNELYILACKFNISIDEMLALNSNHILFSYESVKSMSLDTGLYVESVNNLIKGVLTAEDKEVFVATMEIPFFHYFQFPEISSFKLFFWLKTIWEIPELKDSKYSFKFMNSQFASSVLKSNNELAKSYMQLPTKEIWSEDSINAIIKQIEFYLHSGMFANSDECNELCEKLLLLLDHTKREAELGIKFMYGSEPEINSGEFSLYYNDISYLDNFIMTRINEQLTVYLIHESLNPLITRNESFCRESNRWFKNQLKQASLISKSSGKTRNRMFHNMSLKVEKLMKEIHFKAKP